VLTSPRADPQGRWEYYLVRDEVWAAASGPAITGPVTGPHASAAHWLCIGCLEARLGRRLEPGDFTSRGWRAFWRLVPRVAWSPRLLDRVYGDAAPAPAGLREASPEEFAAALRQALDSSPYAPFATSYSAAGIRVVRGTPLLAAGGKAGILLLHHGGRVHPAVVFNRSGLRELGFCLVRWAVTRHGANYSECFAGSPGHSYLARLGFEVTEARPFDPELAPPGWDYPRFGSPDYLIMTRP
jgi:hypothetical protein